MDNKALLQLEKDMDASFPMWCKPDVSIEYKSTENCETHGAGCHIFPNMKYKLCRKALALRRLQCVFFKSFPRPEGNKICTECHKSKPFTNYGRNFSKMDSFEEHCLECKTVSV